MEVIHSDIDASPLPFLHLMEILKHLPRTGWLRTVQNPESVAAHRYRLSVLAMCAPPGLSRDRCIFLALCHDMAESVVGDIPTYAGVPKEHKHKLELSGVRYIQSLLKPFNAKLGQDIVDAWLEYEDGKTPESQFIRENDKFECMIQAHEYEQKTYGEKDLEEFQGLSSKVQSKEGKAWLELLQHERQDHFSKRKQRIPIIFVIGNPDISKTQCHLISKEFDFHYISLEDILCEKAKDGTYLHADFVRECLEENINVPTSLAVSLLEKEISARIKERKSWCVVDGYPENLQQILDFEEKVQKTNYALYITRSSEDTTVGGSGKSQVLSDKANINADLEDHLKAVDGYFKEINANGSVENVYTLIAKAVQEILEHAEVGK